MLSQDCLPTGSWPLRCTAHRKSQLKYNPHTWQSSRAYAVRQLATVSTIIKGLLVIVVVCKQMWNQSWTPSANMWTMRWRRRFPSVCVYRFTSCMYTLGNSWTDSAKYRYHLPTTVLGVAFISVCTWCLSYFNAWWKPGWPIWMMNQISSYWTFWSDLWHARSSTKVKNYVER